MSYHYCAEIGCLKLIPLERQYCPEHVLHYDDEKEHVCQYTIPVEWQYVFEGKSRSKVVYAETPVKKKVTKLRCACGQEVER